MAAEESKQSTSDKSPSLPVYRSRADIAAEKRAMTKRIEQLTASHTELQVPQTNFLSKLHIKIC